MRGRVARRELPWFREALLAPPIPRILRMRPHEVLLI
jgi:hypothetical protein